MTSKKGKLFVISAPSGSGKTTLCRNLTESLGKRRKGKKAALCVSTTTRRPRAGEREGKDYFFITPTEFIRKRRQHQFLEWAKILSNFYGTPRGFVERQIRLGNDVFLNIDVQGAMKIKRLCGQERTFEAVFIFILPPSFTELKRRLRRRSTENEASVSQRLKLAKWEIGFVKEYDYVVLNDQIHRALARLKEIVSFEGRN